MERTQLAVLGAGPGGYAAAFLAADLGMRVTLVDPLPNPGGVCLHQGCIPSKALLHVAKGMAEARHAEQWGVRFGRPEVDLDRLRAWKNGVVRKLTGGLGILTRQRRVRFLRGLGRFLDGRSLAVETESGEQKLVFEHAIIATGSVPVRPPHLWLDSDRVMDSTAALKLESVPETLLVIGGGYIGLELGTVYAELGSKVTVVEMMDSLLPGADPDLVKVLAGRLKGTFEAVHLETRVAALKEVRGGIQVTFEGGGGGTFEKVLLSVGRRPNTEGLGLENTAVERDGKGFIRVDPRRRTTQDGIFAIGDVAGEPMLAHKASHEGRVAVEAIAGKKAVFEPQAIPAVVYTDPELAWCGLTEAAAKEQGCKIRVSRFPWGASGRALTLGRPEGLTKLVIDPDSERILGVGIVGPGAGDLISEGVLAIEMGAVAKDLSLTIHPHPTLSETLMEAADVFYGLSTHVARPRKAEG